jgi:hypothetical protein
LLACLLVKQQQQQHIYHQSSACSLQLAS